MLSTNGSFSAPPPMTTTDTADTSTIIQQQQQQRNMTNSHSASKASRLMKMLLLKKKEVVTSTHPLIEVSSCSADDDVLSCATTTTTDDDEEHTTTNSCYSSSVSPSSSPSFYPSYLSISPHNRNSATNSSGQQQEQEHVDGDMFFSTCSVLMLEQELDNMNLLTVEERLFASISKFPDDQCVQVFIRAFDIHRDKLDQVNDIRDSTRNQCSLMHAAAIRNHVECMQLLFSYGADVNCLDSSQASPLHYAAANGSKEAVYFLVLNRANVNAKDHYEVFPFLAAMKNNCMGVMRILSMNNNLDIHSKALKGNTCLHLAAQEGNLEQVQFLIEQCKASINRLNRANENVLYLALPHPTVVRYLCERVDSYKDLCKLVSMVNTFGKTLFHEACQSGYLESMIGIIFTLTRKGKQQNQDDRTVEEFLQQRLNEFDTKSGLTPLHMAVKAGHSDIVKYLIVCGYVQVDMQDNQIGNTALHYAIQSKDNDLVNMLFTLGSSDMSGSRHSKRDSRKSITLKIGTDVPDEHSSGNSNIRKRFSLRGIRKSASILFNIE